MVQEGSLFYITDNVGRKISDGFHEFKLFVVASDDNRLQIRGLIGKIGAMSQALRPPTKDNPRFVASEEFHELEFRVDLGGYFVAKTGALNSIMGPDGKAVTKGYHEFFVRDGKIFGRMGDKIEEIDLRFGMKNPNLPPRT